jgi:hypothetical protein
MIQVTLVRSQTARNTKTLIKKIFLHRLNDKIGSCLSDWIFANGKLDDCYIFHYLKV